ncbi:unnamed protein product, partial [Ectocarpus sp. 12 AP-2014]
ALVPLALGLIQKECLENDPFTLEDIFRGARERARYLEPHMNVVQDFQDSVLDFTVSAARRATGKGNLKAVPRRRKVRTLSASPTDPRESMIYWGTLFYLIKSLLVYAHPCCPIGTNRSQCRWSCTCSAMRKTSRWSPPGTWRPNSASRSGRCRPSLTA